MKYQKVSKQNIIEATSKMIAQKGLDKVTVDDVVEKAKVAKGSIYFHFNSKDNLLLKTVQYIAEKRINQLRDALKKIDSAEKKLEMLMSANNSMLRDSPESFLMNYAILLSSHKETKKELALKYVTKFIDFIAEIIKEGISSGQFKKTDPRAFATILLFSNDITGILNSSSSELPKVELLQQELFNLLIVKKNESE